MQKKLIIFSRYPEVGKSKTRLIPGIGAEKATEIHRQMAEFTLRTAQKLKRKQDISIEVAYNGGTTQLMEQWLGSGLSLITQNPGDLGEKMSFSFSTAFESGQEKVVLIGTDCPEITVEILEQAFEALEKHDLVLGPAYDGGYYLIGQRKHYPQLFEEIAWGTDQVLKKTMLLAMQSQISLKLLVRLHDVDHPEDLTFWNQIQERDAQS